MTKHIFVTGGVVSSIGKGLTAAAIGMLLESRGLRVRLQKLDPYINVDPGTMSPFQHGEVYVTDDGAETDLDLGHYERFTTAVTSKYCNFTSGSIYNAVIQKERSGEYLGKTVQVVPHITDEIKGAIMRLVADDVDVVITEVGGTVGDIESLPFLEAIRQFGFDRGRQNVLFVHVTLVPYLHAAQESKTKPTQHSVGRLREIGIMPDVIVLRTERPLGPGVKDKIALFCNVEKQAVIEEIDLQHKSIYELPLVLIEEGLDKVMIQKLSLKTDGHNLNEWMKMLEVLRNPQHEVEIAVVGKYIALKSAYESIYEALDHGGIANGARVRVRRVESEDIEKSGCDKLLRGVGGILVPGGFGIRGTQGKIDAVRYARESKVPYLGICLGMQVACIEFARNVCGLSDANSTEFEKNTEHPIISLLEEQKQVTQMGGTMRLGAYPCVLSAGSFARQAYGADQVSERHRHRYEFNNDYRSQFEQRGARFSGLSPDGKLVEIFEISDHPWFVSTQFHPEFKSKPVKAHPLFRGFIRAALKHSQQKT
jgi:CTP synthase